MKNSKFSIKERLDSFRYAFQGIKTMIIEEHNARIHLIATVVVILLGVVLQISMVEWLWVALAITLVFVTEMINTSIEAICDEITQERRPSIKKAKDVAAGAVLIAAVFAVVVAVCVFIL